ncbi:MAG: hypothetical protein ABJD13_17620 [Paracoccaceae bacterium]
MVLTVGALAVASVLSAQSAKAATVFTFDEPGKFTASYNVVGNPLLIEEFGGPMQLTTPNSANSVSPASQGGLRVDGTTEAIDANGFEFRNSGLVAGMAGVHITVITFITVEYDVTIKTRVNEAAVLDGALEAQIFSCGLGLDEINETGQGNGADFQTNGNPSPFVDTMTLGGTFSYLLDTDLVDQEFSFEMFFGFSTNEVAALGLGSVKFNNLTISASSSDPVTPVPLPANGWAFCLGLGLLWRAGKSQKSMI